MTVRGSWRMTKVTGEPTAWVDLPGGAMGTPMTYMVDGTQYIALTVGVRCLCWWPSGCRNRSA